MASLIVEPLRCLSREIIVDGVTLYSFEFNNVYVLLGLSTVSNTGLVLGKWFVDNKYINDVDFRFNHDSYKTDRYNFKLVKVTLIIKLVFCLSIRFY